ncbi:MAG: hypothetical protein AAF889_04920 [Cyanobacteria bacterium P01_D01_bin.73]
MPIHVSPNISACRKMPFGKNQTTLLDQPVKLSEGDYAWWAVGHVAGEIVMTRLRSSKERIPTAEEVPEGPLWAMVHLTVYGTSDLREEGFDFTKYAALQQIATEMERRQDR